MSAGLVGGGTLLASGREIGRYTDRGRVSRGKELRVGDCVYPVNVELGSEQLAYNSKQTPIVRHVFSGAYSDSGVALQKS